MSRRTRPQQQEQDAAASTLTVVKSCSDKKEHIKVPLFTTLGEFKDLLSRHSGLGNGSIPPSSIRLFYLGRELKTNGRTLAGLGVGRMGVHVLHMHSSVPAVRAKQPEIAIEDDDDDDDDDDPVEVIVAPQQRSRGAAVSASSAASSKQQQPPRAAATSPSTGESSKRGAVDLSAGDNDDSGRGKRRR